MKSEIMDKYAQALFNISKKTDKLDKIYQELVLVKKSFLSNLEILGILYSANLKKDEKFIIIEKIFSSLDYLIISFLKVIIQNNRSVFIFKILEATIKLFEDNLNIKSGILYYVGEFNKNEFEKVINLIEKSTNCHLNLDFIKDDSLIGGFKIVLQNSIYDASLVAKLSSLKDKLDGGVYEH